MSSGLATVVLLALLLGPTLLALVVPRVALAISLAIVLYGGALASKDRSDDGEGFPSGAYDAVAGAVLMISGGLGGAIALFGVCSSRRARRRGNEQGERRHS